MNKALYDALKAAGTPDNLAKQAAESVGNVELLRLDIAELRTDVHYMREDIGTMQKGIGAMREDIGGMREDIGTMTQAVTVLVTRQDQTVEIMRHLAEGQSRLGDTMERIVAKLDDEE